MFFRKSKNKNELGPPLDFNKKSFLVWLEIGVVNMDRAIKFYENVFNLKIEVRYLFEEKIGIFYKDGILINVCIIERKSSTIQNAIKPTFFVDIIFKTTQLVEKNGGKIISPHALLKQKNERGETLIGANLIDNQLGYMAEIMDTEGNAILLYSHF